MFKCTLIVLKHSPQLFKVAPWNTMCILGWQFWNELYYWYVRFIWGHFHKDVTRKVAEKEKV